MNICVKCKKEFEAKNRLKKYCSKECKETYQRYSKNKRCKCGVLIANTSKQCQKCMIKKRDLKGEKNGRWRGGTSEQFQINIYRGILEEAGINLRICAKCGIKHPKIHIHHKDHNHNNNVLNNLIALCPRCHLKEHRANGEEKACLMCGKKKYFDKSKLKKLKNYYCSKSCYNKHRSEFMKGNTIMKDYYKRKVENE